MRYYPIHQFITFLEATRDECCVCSTHLENYVRHNLNGMKNGNMMKKNEHPKIAYTSNLLKLLGNASDWSGLEDAKSEEWGSKIVIKFIFACHLHTNWLPEECYCCEEHRPAEHTHTNAKNMKTKFKYLNCCPACMNTRSAFVQNRVCCAKQTLWCI